MSNTVEELFKKANGVLEQKIRVPAIMQKLAERGYAPTTQEEAVELLKVAELVSTGLASGEIAPIPLRELEQDGTLSKHASAKSEEDFLAFAPQVNVDLAKVEPEVVKSAAMSLFLQASGAL